MSASDILEQIRRLPPAEQYDVAEKVWEEFGDFDDELTPEQAAELDRRLADFEKNPRAGAAVGTSQSGNAATLWLVINGPFIFQPSAEGEFAEAIAWYENERPGLGKEFAGRSIKCWKVLVPSRIFFARFVAGHGKYA